MNIKINPIIEPAIVSTIDSRSKVNPYDEYGYLPLITAPMYAVVDRGSEKAYKDSDIRVCQPRDVNPLYPESFISFSLKDFKEKFLENTDDTYKFVCIDTANGNMSILHDAIKEAKKKYPEMKIMSGNVANQ